MKVSGFTIVRNAIKYDYPIVEAITSVLPICDEFVVAVGNSDDDTLGLIKSIESNKIKIIETVWDDSLREGGRTFAAETDKAFKAVAVDSDWCFYIQADEVLHEQYHEVVKKSMTQYLSDKLVDGLLFSYKHFYGSYDYVGESWSWYRREIRIVRNDIKFFSYKDAQGFRKQPNEKLNVKLIDAYIYHYGWVKEPIYMKKKINNWYRFYKDEEWIEKNALKEPEFDYSNISSLEVFKDSHPQVMKDRIARKNWKFEFDISKKNYSLKEKIKRMISSIFGYRIGEYKNYIIIKD